MALELLPVEPAQEVDNVERVVVLTSWIPRHSIIASSIDSSKQFYNCFRNFLRVLVVDTLVSPLPNYILHQ